MLDYLVIWITLNWVRSRVIVYRTMERTDFVFTERTGVRLGGSAMRS